MNDRIKPTTFANLPPELTDLIWSFAALLVPHTLESGASTLSNAGVIQWWVEGWDMNPMRMVGRRQHILRHTSTVRKLKLRTPNGHWELVDEIRSVTPRCMHPLLQTCRESRHKVMKRYNLEVAFGTLVDFSSDVFRLEFQTRGYKRRLDRIDIPLYDDIFKFPSWTSRIQFLAIMCYYHRYDNARWWEEISPRIKGQFTALKHLCLVASCHGCDYREARHLFMRGRDFTLYLCPPGFISNRMLSCINYSTVHRNLWNEMPTVGSSPDAPLLVFSDVTEMRCKCDKVLVLAAKAHSPVERAVRFVLWPIKQRIIG